MTWRTVTWRIWCGLAGAALAVAALPGPASADPTDPAGPDVQPVAAAEAAPPPIDDGKVVSSPPEIAKTLDGWTLTVGGKDETQLVIAPLTTAVSSREYEVGGTFTGSIKNPSGAPAPAKGVLEVGYQIGCGIEMTTGNGVIVSGNAGGAAGLGIGILPNGNDLEIPSLGASIGGGVAVSLKPGLVNIVPITKKTFAGTAPWVGIHNFRIKIDGCVGESFIRSYATLAKSNDDGDGILSWYGVTKSI